MKPFCKVPFIGSAQFFFAMSFSLAAGAQPAAPPDNNWGLEPLGPNVPARTWSAPPNKRALQTNLRVLPASGKTLIFAQDKIARATIVLAEKPTAAAREAATILQNSFEEISGAKLPIVFETTGAVRQAGSTLIVVGETELGKSKNISAEKLAAEAYILQTNGDALFVVGCDFGEGGTETFGTRHAAYALLERRFNCRWLWPGELGTILPPASTLQLTPIFETDAPAISQRILRDMFFYKPNRVHVRTQQGLRRMGKTDREFLDKTKGAAQWFNAQRTGSSTSIKYGHAFTGWWEKHGAAHPDWFALQPDGTRQQLPPEKPIRERLNVANPEVVEAAAQQAIKDLAADPTLKAASISPNDGGPNAFDMSAQNRKFDPPSAPKTRLNFLVKGEWISVMYPSLSDRYVTFYSRVAEIVAKQYPDRWLGAYAYSAYRTPPLYAKVHPNILIGFVGLDYFDDGALARDRESWNGWAQSADKMVLRPNLFHLGHGFPAVYAHKMDADIKHGFQTTMIAADFDSVQHNWATQGLNYYVLARLLWDPSQNVDAIIKDYCDAGFGAASPQIQKYFARLEAITSQLAAHDSTNSADKAMRDEEEDLTPNAYDKFRALAPQYYTPQVLDELQTLLDDAKKATGNDESIARRIVFLGDGLRYARIQSEAFGLLFGPETPDKKDKISATLQKRQLIFDDIFENDFYAVHVAYLSYRETNIWRPYDWNPAGEK